ncbi:putative bifunctional diguanylate cyclase/phosphodiesterase [Actinoplanes sp. GCM10030250]|uniref:putative bifunctional diguanylate cyclase/phosphodiesterase n=1 Tax=Actinoplanes sp. GCM10030250 TaxID=3273376 RepID=UPI0036183CCC
MNQASSPDPPPHGVTGDLERVCARNLLNATDEVIYFKDLRSRFLWLSKAWGALTGGDPAELLGLTDFDVYGHAHAADAYADEQRIIATGTPMVNKQEHETWPDRPDRWVTSTKFPLRDDDGQIIGTFGISRDITRLVQAEQEAIRNAAALTSAHADISRVEAQLRTVLDTSSDAIALYDADLRYQYVNTATERLLRMRSRDMLGRTDRELNSDSAVMPLWESGLASVLETGRSCSVDFSVGTGDGRRDFQAHMAAHRDTDQGQPVGVVTSAREVTELKRTQDELAHQAVHDPVTGLANRVLLADRLNGALARMKRRPGRIVLLFIDLDQFKAINDTYGHGVGDKLLVEAGRRLTAILRPSDTVARFGGDEFVVVLDEICTEDDAHVTAGRVVDSLSAPFVDNGHELFVTASVGLVVTTDPFATGEDLIRDADAAMYQAKARGRNCYQFFDPELRDRAAKRYAVEADLARALEHRQLRLEYQPVFSLQDHRIVGAEALIRWDHPERGTVPPAEFIGIAEDRGLIVSIGTWALHEACRRLVAWSVRRDPALPPLTMAVNVSTRQLCAPDFAGVVKDVLDRHRIAPAQLCLELTETAQLLDMAEARDALADLARLGVHIALDDFGTGYSSLAHLTQFPANVLKIDRSFVNQLETEGRGREIVAAVTTMGHALGMTVVAEGIETTGQLDRLIALGCEQGQGYLLARPLRPDALAALLDRGSEPGPPQSAGTPA